MKKLVIVGGGVIGLCTAYYGAQAGMDVLVLEQGSESDEGCSVGNAGMIVPSHFVPLTSPGMVSMGLRMLPNPKSPFGFRFSGNFDLIAWAFQFWRNCNANHVAEVAPYLLQLNLDSKHEFEKMSANFGPFDLTKRGLLMLCKTEKALEHEKKFATEAISRGLSVKILNSEETSKVDPGIEMAIAGAVHFEQDAHISPDQFFRLLKKELVRFGVKIKYNCKVTGFETKNAIIEAVKSDDEIFVGDTFVLAGGSWSSELVQSLPFKLPVVAGKGYSMTIQKPSQLPELCSILVEARVAVTPMGSRLRIAGTMELGSNDLSINKNRVAGIKESVPLYFPKLTEFEMDQVPVWSGLRPCTPDGVPIIGKVKHFNNLSIGTGHAMMGLSLGPITGKRIIEEIVDQNFTPSRFSSPNRF